jgi:hypothetical protein
LFDSGVFWGRVLLRLVMFSSSEICGKVRVFSLIFYSMNGTKSDKVYFWEKANVSWSYCTFVSAQKLQQTFSFCLILKGWHDDASPNETSLVISTLDYEPLWSECPRVETDQRILRPKYFLSLDVASQPMCSVFGDFITTLNFQTLIIIWSLGPHSQHLWIFQGKKIH